MNDTVTDIARQLLEKKMHLVTVESCTGGMVAAELTTLAGSSQWFERGFVTYSNRSKQECVGVDAKVIQQHGAVSEQVAIAMAQGGLAHSHANVALAITGIAGPGGGSELKPIGMVCFAWVVRDFSQVDTAHFKGDRAAIRQQACQHALTQLQSLLSISSTNR